MPKGVFGATWCPVGILDTKLATSGAFLLTTKFPRASSPARKFVPSFAVTFRMYVPAFTGGFVLSEYVTANAPMPVLFPLSFTPALSVSPLYGAVSVKLKSAAAGVFFAISNDPAIVPA
ncbi:hypothetical protein R80B4_02199 [Fibrobacteres bacterium R8-0-B4]